MRRTQKISIGFCADYFSDPLTTLLHEISKEMLADILTKGLDPATHWAIVKLIGMG